MKSLLYSRKNRRDGLYLQTSVSCLELISSFSSKLPSLHFPLPPFIAYFSISLIKVSTDIIDPQESTDEATPPPNNKNNVKTTEDRPTHMTLPLNDMDTLYVEVRDQHVEKFGTFLQNQAKALKESHANFSDKNKDLTELHQFVKQIPVSSLCLAFLFWMGEGWCWVCPGCLFLSQCSSRFGCFIFMCFGLYFKYSSITIVISFILFTFTLIQDIYSKFEVSIIKPFLIF